MNTHAALLAENRRLAAELRAAERRYRDLLDTSLDGIVYTTLDGYILDANGAFQRMLGYSLEELRQKTYQELTPRKWWAPEADTVIRQVLTHGYAEEYEKEYIRKDGHVFPVSLRVWLVRDTAGRPQRMFGMVRDITERKWAEQTLRRTTNTLNSILTSASEFAIGAIDHEYRVVHFNPAAERLFGMSAADVVGRTLLDIHNERRVPSERLAEAVAGARRDGKWEHTFQLHRPDGQVSDVHAVVMPMVGQEENGRGFVLFARDVTEQVALDEQARTRRDLALALSVTDKLDEALLLGMQAAMQAAEFDCGAVYLRDEVTQDIKLVHCAGFLPASTGAEVDQEPGPALPDHLDAELPEYTTRTESGGDGVATSPHAGVRLPLRVDGRVVGSIALASRRPGEIPEVVRDSLASIAAQVSSVIARLRLSADRQRLSAAVAQAAEAMVIVDVGGTIEYVNPAFEEITGYAADEVLGGTPRVFQGSSDHGMCYRDLRATLMAGNSWSGRMVNRRKSGELFHADATISPVRDNGGAVVKYVCVARDVTREVTLEEHLRQSQKMRAVGRLAGGVAHELNNLLTTVLGCAEGINDVVSADHPASDYGARIRGASERAAGLIRQLLSFSRQRVVEPKVINLSAAVQDTVRLLHSLMGGRVRVDVRFTAPTGLVRIDPGQLQELLTNLALNARDAMPRGGTLTIETATADLAGVLDAAPEPVAPGEYVVLTVRDTGVGMSPQTQARIFEPFFTTKSGEHHAGLGLAAVYGLVHQNRGRILVDSTPGRGTVFSVYLPRERGAAPQQMPPMVRPRLRQSETLLLVEDEDEVRELEHDVLASAGYEVLVAANAAEALRICEDYRGPLDMLVTDVVMPGLSGQELAERLTQRKLVTRVLYISGYAEAIVHENDRNGTVAGFLPKPFTRARLLAKVREVLESADTARSSETSASATP